MSMTHPPELITGLPPADLAAPAAATPFLEVWYATVGLLVPRKLLQSAVPWTAGMQGPMVESVGLDVLTCERLRAEL